MPHPCPMGIIQISLHIFMSGSIHTYIAWRLHTIAWRHGHEVYIQPIFTMAIFQVWSKDLIYQKFIQANHCTLCGTLSHNLFPPSGSLVPRPRLFSLSGRKSKGPGINYLYVSFASFFPISFGLGLIGSWFLVLYTVTPPCRIVGVATRPGYEAK